MAALDFPSSPTIGQVYTANGKSWQWDGTAWVSYNRIISIGVTGSSMTIYGSPVNFPDAASLVFTNSISVSCPSVSFNGNTTLGDASGDTLTINAGTTTFAQGTANGVLYLNGSKVATSGSGLVFDGLSLGIGASPGFYQGSGLYITRSGFATIRLNDSSAGGTAAEIKQSDSSGLILESISNRPIQFNVIGSETARLTSKGLLVGYTSDGSLSGKGNAIFSGSVGIGTSSPGAKLEIAGVGPVVRLKQNAAGAATYYQMDNTVETGGKIWRFGYTGASGIPTFSLFNQTDNIVSWIADSSGNLGLGVTPTAKLDVLSSATYIQNLTGPNGVYTRLGTSTSSLYTINYTTGSVIYTQEAVSLSFGTGGYSNRLSIGADGSCVWKPDGSTSAMTLDASGSLLIGVTSTGWQNANGFSWDSPGRYVIVNHANGTPNGTGYVLFGYDGSGIGSISQNGTTAVLYNTSSDQRLKTNITSAGSAVQSILDFPVDQFDWISDGSHVEFGAVAQKVINVIPEMVSAPEDPDEMWGIDWSKAVPRLIRAYQELHAEIELLKAKVN